MPVEQRSKNKDGSSLSANEYAALVLAVIVPIVGLGLGIWLRSEGRPIANRVIGLSVIAAVIWVILALSF